jgi:ribosomal protein S12 methylthiotransferase
MLAVHLSEASGGESGDGGGHRGYPANVSPAAALVTLGCARNEVDSEELAGRLSGDGWSIVADADAADVVLVNTCGFVAAAKKDSIDAVLEAAESGRPVVAVGCLAERYGRDLAEALPEARAVLGFDAYPEIAQRVADVLAGRTVAAHLPTDRRRLLPLTPTERPAVVDEVVVPGHGWVPRGRRRLDDGPVAYLKLASGCDRRCSFCAIPSFRGSFVSRPPSDVLAEARWLAASGARELVLVSENSTSYGKDLGHPQALEALLPRLAELDGITRVRVTYLQPAELRPTLLRVIATTPGVTPYFDLSFQHASGPVLRRMRRFGSTGLFLDQLDQIRALTPTAGTRSNVIVGFPGETDADVDELERFLAAARLDAVGVFGYSDEDGTEAERMAGKLDEESVTKRVRRIHDVADELVDQRAAERIGETVEVLVDTVAASGELVGTAAHQGSDVDGVTRVRHGPRAVRRGEVVVARVVAAEGVDLIARAVAP